MSMQRVSSTQDTRTILSCVRAQGKTVSLVPTMGSLHSGHLSLVELAKAHSDFVVLSVFVNPTQFNDPKDYEAYPHSIEEDAHLAQEAGVSLFYEPSQEDIYTCGVNRACEPVIVRAGSMAHGLCGQSRPGHFDGVATIVSILFNIVLPNTAVFGEKDFQQLRVIEQLVKDLHFPVEIVAAPLVRDADGLALSSRNSRLSIKERASALAIPESLLIAADIFARGERDTNKIKSAVISRLSMEDNLKVDYVSLVDDRYLNELNIMSASPARLALSAFVGNVRLIDNLRLCAEEI